MAEKSVWKANRYSRYMTWKKITERATKSVKERISREGAREQGRCQCEGCSYCFGQVGQPCGAKGSYGTRCGWCR